MDLSSLITKWWECPPAITSEVAVSIVDDVIRALLESPGHVHLLFGNTVHEAFSIRRLHRLLPGTKRVAEFECDGVFFYLHRTGSGRQFWVVPSPHPSCWWLTARMHAAVQLA